MQPDFSVSALDGVEATYPSIYGDIRSHWEREGKRIIWNITIPANTTATLVLPNGKRRNVESGNYQF